MTKKVRCTVTGNVIYMTEKRYNKLLAKYNNDESYLKSSYISMKGKKIASGELDPVNSIKNRIKCTITNQWCYITNQRIEAGIKKYGSWESLCQNYACRIAKRLLKQGKTIDEIKQMILNGTFPEK